MELELRRATVRIDAKPGGKKFQGVWLEFDDGDRWVIDYRPRPVWRPFEDAVVLVTGRTYQPVGQAINATHLEVEQMRFETPVPGASPILEVGPKQRLGGAFELRGYPEGSKGAGSADWYFVSEGGASYRIYGAIGEEVTAGEPVEVEARQVVIDLSYAATPGGPHLWIASVG